MLTPGVGHADVQRSGRPRPSPPGARRGSPWRATEHLDGMIAEPMSRRPPGQLWRPETAPCPPRRTFTTSRVCQLGLRHANVAQPRPAARPRPAWRFPRTCPTTWRVREVSSPRSPCCDRRRTTSTTIDRCRASWPSSGGMNKSWRPHHDGLEEGESIAMVVDDSTTVFLSSARAERPGVAQARRWGRAAAACAWGPSGPDFC